MNESFVEFLNQMEADPDMIQQALRLHLSERTNDLTPEEMLTELRTAVTSEQNEQLNQQLSMLERDSIALEESALIYFENAWKDEIQRPSIRNSFKHAKDRLPVVEVAIIAIVGMYGMYLIATQGITEHTIKRNPDGSYEETIKREPFAPIVSAISGLFGKIG